MTPERAADHRAARAIATMMRIGTTSATVLLTIGAVFLAIDGTAAAVLLTIGCGVLIAMPAVRLAMMAGFFARLHDRRYLVVTLVVLALVVVGGIVGLTR